MAVICFCGSDSWKLNSTYIFGLLLTVCVGALKIAFRRLVNAVIETMIVITMDLSLLLSQCLKMLFVFLTGASGSLSTFRFILIHTSRSSIFSNILRRLFSTNLAYSTFRGKRKAYEFIMLSLRLLACQFFQSLDQVLHYISCAR
jgi:hypothetical protein